ncbi:peptide ABC transporter substrate-binding protein [Numidum massiliense]|uniref:peptide ABC transporter substrate-binding protein n=1 Tax=Numidum massiliense TaxID=1522315 RepID=UPI0006D538B0|nr:peptide ABC transporter substrate-binding protein [Numidum massiliense]
MNKKFLLLSIVFVLILTTFAAGCGQKSANEGDGQGKQAANGEGKSAEKGKNDKPAKEQVIHMNERAEPPDLDSATSTDAASHMILSNVMEGLVILDKDMKPIPGMAEELPEISDDGKTYTFKLRDAKWSDGSPVTANDFEYAWKRALNPETKSQYAFIFSEIKNAEAYNKGKAKAEDVGVKAVDEKTLEVTLEHPVPYFTSKMAFSTFYPQKQEFVEKMGKKYAKEDDALLYNGPFKLANWKHESGWEYVKNENYWDVDSVKLDKVTWDVVKDTSTGIDLYETGKFDVTLLSQDFVTQYKDREDFTTRPEFVTAYLEFNLLDPFLKNDKIRAAIAGAFDKETHAKVIMNDGSTAAYGFVPPGMAGPEGTDGEPYREYVGEIKTAQNVEEAKKLFKEGLKELGLSKPPKLEYLTDDNDTARRTAEFLQEEFKKNLGLEIEINQQTFAARLDLAREKKFQLYLSLWGADYNDPLSFMDLFVTDGPYNDASWSNKTFDEAIKFSQTSGDQKARVDKMAEAEKLLIKEAPIAPLYYRHRAYLWRPEIKELIRPPYGPGFYFKWAYVE